MGDGAHGGGGAGADAARRALLVGGAWAAGGALVGVRAEASPRRVAPPGEATSGRGAALPDDPAVHLRTWLRLVADLSGAVRYAYACGVVYGFLPQADDVALEQFARALYGYRACVARQVVRVDGDRYALKVRAWNYYTDVDGDAPIDRLVNPYTGRTVDCPPVLGPARTVTYTPRGPQMDAPFPLESSELDRPFRLGVQRAGERTWLRRAVYSRLKPGGIDWWKLEADLTVHSLRSADLADSAAPRLENEWFHNLVAEWQTWMRMHGTPGHVLFNGAGGHYDAADRLPPEFVDAIARRFPGTLEETARWRP